MEFFRYYGNVLRVAFTHSLDIAQAVIFLLVIIVGGITYFFPRLSLTLDAADWATALAGWQVATGVLSMIVLIRLVLAPYWIYKELYRQIRPVRREKKYGMP